MNFQLFIHPNKYSMYLLKHTPWSKKTLFCLFCLTLTHLVQVSTDSWQVGFYSLTLGFALLFNMSDSVFQVVSFFLIYISHLVMIHISFSTEGAFSSVIGRFPSSYMGAMMQVQGTIHHAPCKYNVNCICTDAYHTYMDLCIYNRCDDAGARYNT